MEAFLTLKIEMSKQTQCKQMLEIQRRKDDNFGLKK